VFVNVLGETTNAVAAHFHLAAVGVVNLHLEVGDLRSMNCQQLIRADAETTIAKAASDGAQIRDIVFQAIDKNKIIAAAMHLGERDFHLTRTLHSVEKDPYASSHSIDSLEFVFVVHVRVRSEFAITFHGHGHDDR
jgi:hypothetical protein